MIGTEVLGSVTTPLALAALCILAGTGALKAVSRRKPSASLTLFIHWGLVLALVLGLLANVSFLVIASFGREVRIAGSVRDDADRPLSRAIVEIPGRGRGITDDYGAFEFSVPDSRKADEYEGIVSLEGYGSKRFTLKGPIPRQNVSISLKRPTLEASELIKPPEDVIVSHYLGQPVVMMKVRLFNPLPARIVTEGLSASLTGPDGVNYPLEMVGHWTPMGQYIAGPFNMIALEAGQTWTLGYRFMYINPEVSRLLGDAQKEFPPTSRLPAVGQLIFSPEFAARLEQFMKSSMAWKPGKWTITVRCSVHGRDYSRQASFPVRESHLDIFRSVSRHYRTGFSTLPTLPDPPDQGTYIRVSVE